MNVIIKPEYKVPVKMWLDDIEASAMEQVENLAKLPFAFHHIAIMPDAHTGYGMPIGGVLATENAIVPNAVGVDIGCGMNAVKTSLQASEATYDKLKLVIDEAKKNIPVGNAKHDKPQDDIYMPQFWILDNVFDEHSSTIVSNNYEKAKYQIGTLGGGNHFIEIQKDETGYVWLMLHSGSRGLGFAIGNHYNNIAKRLNKKWHSSVPADYELAFLPFETQEATEYMAEMQYAIQYAYNSRQLMMERLQDALEKVFGNIDYGDMINISHNFASVEKHYKHEVIVHRKGATQAFEGQIGIIPSSQGTPSYIVRGKGNPESFMSCSHGSGRKMGRNEARRRLNLEEEQAKMVGIVHSMTSQQAIDEAPSAYKDIDVVLNNEKDLVDIVEKLYPLGNLKG